jgi:alkylhydroperoxidase family enzyme
MARISYPERETLPPELLQTLEEMPRHAPIEMLAHSPAVAERFLRLAQAQFTSLELALVDRELLILTVAALVDCEYEYQQHIPVSEAAGIDSAMREAIWNGSLTPADLCERDRVLVAFIRATLRSAQVEERLVATVREYFSEREIVEILQLVGFYWGLGRLCTVLDLEIETATDLSSVNAVANLSGRT